MEAALARPYYGITLSARMATIAMAFTTARVIIPGLSVPHQTSAAMDLKGLLREVDSGKGDLVWEDNRGSLLCGFFETHRYIGERQDHIEMFFVPFSLSMSLCVSKKLNFQQSLFKIRITIH
jgi:hypothetical protein